MAFVLSYKKASTRLFLVSMPMSFWWRRRSSRKEKTPSRFGKMAMKRSGRLQKNEKAIPASLSLASISHCLCIMTELDAKKPVIYTGDLNVAHEEIDIKNPDSNHMSTGFTDQERSMFTNLLSHGFTDTFRALHPNDVTYSWWSYRFHAREKNIGWRIDYFVVSNRLMPKVKDSKILTDITGSDHCPIELDLAD